MAKEVFTEEQFEKLKSDLYAISPRLFVFTNRDGQFVFTVYSPDSGFPITGDIIAIFHKGYGNCSILDGAAIPGEGIHILENGWGLAVVNIGHDCSNKAAIALAKETAKHMMWLITKGGYGSKFSLASRFSIKFKYLTHRIAKKIAAARAA